MFIRLLSVTVLLPECSAMKVMILCAVGLCTPGSPTYHGSIALVLLEPSIAYVTWHAPNYTPIINYYFPFPA